MSQTDDADTGQGIPEAIQDDSSGLLLAPGNPDELARALERLDRDPDLRRQLGHRAREVARDRFTSSAMVRGVEAVYREILPGSRGAGA